MSDETEGVLNPESVRIAYSSYFELFDNIIAIKIGEKVIEAK